MILLLLTLLLLISAEEPTTPATPAPAPSVVIAILARSRAHILPNYLGLIEQLNYPPSSISFYIQTDHNQDNTPSLLAEWVENARGYYNDITFNTSSHISYTQSLGPSDWEEDRYIHLMKIRQNVLDHARSRNIRYVFFVDTDNFIINPNTLQVLINRKKPIVAPMLIVKEKIAYSNFWCGMTVQGYYKSAPEYFQTLSRDRVGVFKVPMVHSTLLIDLHTPNSDKLRYYPMLQDYSGPVDDIIHFALNAQAAGVDIFVDNEVFYGYLMIQGDYHTVGEEIAGFQEYKVEVIYSGMTSVLKRSSFLKESREEPDKLGFDEIYMINLVRRPERRGRMMGLFEELRIDAKIFDAVDGKKITQEELDEKNVKQLPGYEDPFFKRPLKFGEIGCFLSHFYIWEEVVEKGLKEVIIFEDDVRFKPNFRSELHAIMSEVSALKLDWDLIYLGRKILEPKRERWVSKSSRLVIPKYSYWTVGYMLSLSGAKKLLAQTPAQKMIAVDEFLPLMFDSHPK